MDIEINDDLIYSIYCEFDLDFDDIEHTKIRVFKTDEDLILVYVMYKSLLCQRFMDNDGEFFSKDDDRVYGVEVEECIFDNQLGLFNRIYSTLRLTRDYDISLYSDKPIGGSVYTVCLSKKFGEQTLSDKIILEYKDSKIRYDSDNKTKCDCLIFELKSNTKEVLCI